MPPIPPVLREFLGLSESTAENIRTLVIAERERAVASAEKRMNLRRQQDSDDDLATRNNIAALLTDRQKEILRRLGETMSPLARFKEAACFYLLPRDVAAKAPPGAAGGGAPLQRDTPVTQEFTCPPLPLPKRLVPQ